MMKMKRILCACLTVTMMVTQFTACGNNNTIENTNIAAEQVEEEKEYNDGVDTKIEITGYTEYNGNQDSYFLSKGDKVAVITPSSMASKEQTERTVAGLKKWGFEPVLGKYDYPEIRTMDECIEDFEWALKDPEIKAIFCVRGGYGATEILDTIPNDLIASTKKPIIGYSDISAYHSAWTVAGLPSMYACMSGTFSGLPEACVEAELNMMTGKIPSYKCEANSYCKTGSAEGILIGGNLSTITATLNTAYDCTKIQEPYILFLEDIGENIQSIHRYLTILKHAGVLDNASGIIFGEWIDYEPDKAGNFGDERGGFYQSVADMIDKQLLGDSNVPVAYDFPTGHGDVNYPLLIGATVKLNVTKDSYTVSWDK